MKNIVLIGIMGSGKTTFGKILSQKTGHEMIDLDDYLVNRYVVRKYQNLKVKSSLLVVE